MAFCIACIIIGCMILGAGIYYLIQEKDNSRIKKDLWDHIVDRCSDLTCRCLFIDLSGDLLIFLSDRIKKKTMMFLSLIRSME